MAVKQVKYLIITDACPYCKILMKQLGDKLKEFKIINASTPEGLKFALKYNVFAVPTRLTLNQNGEQISRIEGNSVSGV